MDGDHTCDKCSFRIFGYQVLFEAIFWANGSWDQWSRIIFASGYRRSSFPANEKNMTFTHAMVNSWKISLRKNIG